MKSEVTKVEPKETFKPINLTITIESQEEFNDVYFLLNYSPMVAATKHIPHIHIREQLGQHAESNGFMERRKLLKIILDFLRIYDTIQA